MHKGRHKKISCLVQGGGALALLHDQVINFSFNKINKCFELLFVPLCIIEGLISNLMNKKSSLSIYFKYSYNLTNEVGGWEVHIYPWLVITGPLTILGEID